MAQRTLSATMIGMAGDVVLGAGSSIGSYAVQVTVDTTNADSKTAAIKALQTIMDRLVMTNWPDITV
jgi:hypothetical protein